MLSENIELIPAQHFLGDPVNSGHISELINWNNAVTDAVQNYFQSFFPDFLGHWVDLGNFYQIRYFGQAGDNRFMRWRKPEAFCFDINQGFFFFIFNFHWNDIQIIGTYNPGNIFHNLFSICKQEF